MPNFTISPSRFELLGRPLLPHLAKVARDHNIEAKCRKFSFKTHLLLTIFSHLQQVESTRALIEALNDLDCNSCAPDQTPSLRQLVEYDELDFWGQPVTLNQSSYSRANAQRPWQGWRDLAAAVLNDLRPHLNQRQLEGLPVTNLAKLLVVDGSLFDCLSTMNWATYRQAVNKFKLHLFYALDGTPTELTITEGNGSEREILRLHLHSGFTYLFDRGYNDYELYALIVAKNADFVTRLLKNARYEVVAEQALDAESLAAGIHSDRLIRLRPVRPRSCPSEASEPDSSSSEQPLKLKEQRPVLRLVVAQGLDGKCYEILTSRRDLSAKQVALMYLYRWEIETFFGWFKRHMVFEHWYSQNPNGVLIQIWAGLLTFLLLKSYQVGGQRLQFRALRVENLRWLRRHLTERVSAVEVESYTLFGLKRATAPPVHS
jgi:Transposase DDE domain/Domain of unknown function (DUF4372)